MARSLAFWIGDVDDNLPRAKVELHFNLWTLRSKKINYLDIGVLFEGLPSNGTINFYFPFNSGAAAYDPDLGKTVCTNEELIKAIFNCQYKDKQPITQTGICDFIFVTNDGDEPIRFFTDLQKSSHTFSNGVSIADEQQAEGKDGFRLTLPLNLFPQDSERKNYFRFRLKLSSADLLNILNKDRPTYSAVTNNHEVTETIDFRLNEARNLPQSVSRCMRNEGIIKKIHFFLIRDGREEFKLSHTNYKRCRILENDLWGQYLGISEEKLKEQMLIYHWTTKDGNEIDHFSAFAKFSSKPVRWPQIIAVIIVALLIGFFQVYLQISYGKNWKKL